MGKFGKKNWTTLFTPADFFEVTHGHYVNVLLYRKAQEVKDQLAKLFGNEGYASPCIFFSYKCDCVDSFR